MSDTRFVPMHIGRATLILGLLIFMLAPAFAFDEKPVDLVVLLDRSGSMQSSDPEGLSVAAASFLLEQLSLAGNDNRGGIVYFNNDTYTIPAPQSGGPVALTADIDRLINLLQIANGTPVMSSRRSFGSTTGTNTVVEEFEARGNTELGPALRRAIQLLKGDDGRRKVLVLISDGEPVPNRHDPERLQELSGTIDEQTLRAWSRAEVNSGEYRRLTAEVSSRYLDDIIESIVPEINREGIAIYPVALMGPDSDPGLVDALRAIRLANSGDDLVVEADSSNLIRRLYGIVPSGPRHVALFEREGAVAEGQERWEYSFVLPDYAEIARVFFSYPGDTSAGEPNLAVALDGRPVAGIDGGTAGNADLRRVFKNSDTIVYQSALLYGLSGGGHRLSITLEDQSVSGSGLPAADLLIDVRADFVPSVQIAPPVPVPQDSRYRIRIELTDRLGTTQEPIVDGEVHIYGVGETVDQYRRVTDLTVENGVLLAVDDEGLPVPGDYDMEALLNLSPIAQSTPPPVVRFRNRFEVRRAAPPELYLSVGPRILEDGDMIELEPVGERQRESVLTFRIQTEQQRFLDGLSVVLDPFVHVDDPEQSLVTGFDPWGQVLPQNTNGLSSDNPLDGELRVVMPGGTRDVVDGTYQSSLRIMDRRAVLREHPVRITVRVPRLMLRGPDDGPAPEEATEATVQRRIVAPSTEPYEMSLPVWTTSVESVSGVLSFEATAGEVDDGTGGVRLESVRFSALQDEYEIPGTAEESRRGGDLAFALTIDDPTIDRVTIRNTAIVGAPGHETLRVPVEISVRYVSSIVLRLIAALVSIVAFYLLVWHRKLDARFLPVVRGRGRAGGAVLKRERELRGKGGKGIKVDPDEAITIEYRGKKLLSFENTGGGWSLSFGRTPRRVLRDTGIAEEEWIDRPDSLGPQAWPQDVYSITLSWAKPAVTMTFTRPDDVEQRLGGQGRVALKVSEFSSPTRSGFAAVIGALVGVVLTVFGLVSFVVPYGVLNMFL